MNAADISFPHQGANLILVVQTDVPIWALRDTLCRRISRRRKHQENNSAQSVVGTEQAARDNALDVRFEFGVVLCGTRGRT